MDKTESLLNQLRELLTQQEAINRERQLHGENFNIFKILQLARNETRLHSAFLAELLNPEGSHGLGKRFLESFLKHVCNDLELDTDYAKVTIEKIIDDINEDATKGGRIDILIEDNRGKAIIIENKIDASDQKNQLLRYHNYGIETYKDFRILYLTKEGHQASEYSTNSQKIDYRCISYRTDIIGWLNNCVEIAVGQPRIRETIRQYILNLQDILGIMDENTTKRIVDIATSEENVDTTLSLLKNSYVIEQRIRLMFIESLKILGEKLGFSVSVKDDEETMASLSAGNQWIVFTNPNESTEWGFYVGWSNHNIHDGARYGITRLKKEGRKNITEAQLKELPHIWEEYGQEEAWPLGWNYFRGEDGKHGNWWQWNDYETLRDMSNGKLLSFIEGQLTRVNEEKLMEKIVEIITHEGPDKAD